MKSSGISRVVVPVLSGIIVCAALALSIYFTQPGKVRTVFYFHSLDSDSLCTEIRYLPKNPVQGDVALFVEEMVLGPMTNRFVPLFPLDTKIDFCFERDGKLYVGLSKEALKFTPQNADIKEGVNLLKQNVLRKFTNINAVLVYIDGKSAFEKN